MPLNNIEDIIADIRAGKMVVLMDDEERENEGDLIMARGHVRAEDNHVMARYGRAPRRPTPHPPSWAQTRQPLPTCLLPLVPPFSDVKPPHAGNRRAPLPSKAGLRRSRRARQRPTHHVRRNPVRQTHLPLGEPDMRPAQGRARL